MLQLSFSILFQLFIGTIFVFFGILMSIFLSNFITKKLLALKNKYLSYINIFPFNLIIFNLFLIVLCIYIMRYVVSLFHFNDEVYLTLFTFIGPTIGASYFYKSKHINKWFSWLLIVD